MRFPRRFPTRSAVRPVLATAVLVAGMTVAAGPAAAQPLPPPPPRVMHHVKYSVFSEVPVPQAEIYYREVDPPNWAEYSHNPYKFSPNVEAPVGPDQMWTLDVMLADPDQFELLRDLDFYAWHARQHADE